MLVYFPKQGSVVDHPDNSWIQNFYHLKKLSDDLLRYLALAYDPMGPFRFVSEDQERFNKAARTAGDVALNAGGVPLGTETDFWERCVAEYVSCCPDLYHRAETARAHRKFISHRNETVEELTKTKVKDWTVREGQVYTQLIKMQEKGIVAKMLEELDELNSSLVKPPEDEAVLAAQSEEMGVEEETEGSDYGASLDEIDFANS